MILNNGLCISNNGSLIITGVRAKDAYFTFLAFEQPDADAILIQAPYVH
jgi:hypothetical protein